MLIDKAVIPHYVVEPIPFGKLKNMVDINQEYLREKNTWYVVDSKLQYFKVRNDLRLFTELFFQEFASMTLGLDTLKYNLAYIRIKKNGELDKSHTMGLLSENFQNPYMDYFLVNELCNSEISNCRHYGEFSLSNLLSFLKDTIASEDYKKSEDFLIKLFVADAFTMQLDRNENNIAFEIPSIEGLSHLKRLRASLVSNHLDNTKQYLEKSANYNQDKIIGLTPSKVYDNERILGIDHKNVFVNDPGDVWTPIFPYTPELYFGTTLSIAKNQMKEISDSKYNHLDPNLAELYLNHYEECRDYIDTLSRDDRYIKLIESFCKPNSPICLDSSQSEQVISILNSRKNEFKKILKLG